MKIRCIILEKADGTIATRGGLGPRMLAQFGGDADKALAHILQELVPSQNPDAVKAYIADVEFPECRTFRAAWVPCTQKGCRVDMEKARGLWRERLREARAPKLAALDVEYMRADERGDPKTKADIAARKQALRDATSDPAIDAAETPEQLKAVWPECLA